MKCKNCNEEYDQMMFDVCPYCLFANEEVIEYENDIVEKQNGDEVLEIINSELNQDTKTAKRVEEIVVIENFDDIRDDENYNEQVDISDISELSTRSKNSLKRHGIYTFGMLKEYVENNDLSDIRNLGERSKQEILCVLEMYSKEKIVFVNEEEEHIDVTLFKNVNEQLCDLGVELLVTLGIPTRTVNSVINRGLIRIGQLQNISEKALMQIVGNYNIEKFRGLEKNLEKSILELLEALLDDYVKDDDFQIALMKAEGFTLQDIGEMRNCTRERIRQIIKKFNQKLDPLVLPIIHRCLNSKGFVTAQEILDIYDNDDYDKILINWCRSNDELEYLDFADIYLPAGKTKHENEEKILNIAVNFVGEGIDLYENMDELEMLLKKNGFVYLDAGDILNLLQKNRYKVYGNYVAPKSLSYGYLCSRIVAKKFPNGIKLYDGKELDLLRKYAWEEYGDIGISEDNRALSTRLSDFLILSGRGAVTASENIQVDMGLLEEIKAFIDNSLERELYYSHLFSEYEGILQVMSNIDNYNFLHGVLMMYYPDEYDYTRDYLKKKGTGFISGRLCDKISRFILDRRVPVHKNDIKRKFPGMTDIVLFNAVNSSDDLFMWDYSTYYSTKLLDIKNEDLDYLKRAIIIIMDKHNGYCSDSLLFAYIQKNNPSFLTKNNMEAENNLYYFCYKNFGEIFDFRRPHIGQKGLLQEISAKNVALYMLGYPEVLAYSSYAKVSEELMWSAVTAGLVFNEIESDYIRISEDDYVKKEKFHLSEKDLMTIEKCLISSMNYDFVSLITFNQWEELPEIEYTWNHYLLHDIVVNYSENLRIIEPRVRDRRFERGIVIANNHEAQDYIDIIVHMLKIMEKKEISENNLCTLLVINGLAYKMIPHEVYVTDKIFYKNDKFIIM